MFYSTATRCGNLVDDSVNNFTTAPTYRCYEVVSV